MTLISSLCTCVYTSIHLPSIHPPPDSLGRKWTRGIPAMRLFFFSSFLFDGVGHVLRLYHQDSIPTWLFTRLKNNGLVFFFFSHLIFIIDLSSSNSYKDTTKTFCVARRRKKKTVGAGVVSPHTQTHPTLFEILLYFRRNCIRTMRLSCRSN